MQGVILYDGMSLINRRPIISVITGLKSSSKNRKTGGLVQTYILDKENHPFEAVRNRKDESICGTCPLRGSPDDNIPRLCYVNVSHGPSGVWRAFNRGSYPVMRPFEIRKVLSGRKVRLGTYGEITAIPFHRVESAIRQAKCLGYTHRWRECDKRWKTFLMASVQSEQEYWQAKKQGWRTFRVKQASGNRLSTEIECPASKEKGFIRTCETCMACDGHGNNPRKRDIVINVHGKSYFPKYFERVTNDIS